VSRTDPGIQAALLPALLDPGGEGLVVDPVMPGESLAADPGPLESIQQGLAVILRDLDPAQHVGLQNRGRFLHGPRSYGSRRSLNRWSPAYRLLSNTKDSTLNEKVTKHEWTKETIGAAKLPAHREKLAFKIAVVLAHADGDEVEGRFYRKSLPIIVQGLSRGDILKAIADLSAQDSPELEQVARQITELTKQEFGDFLAIVQGRLDGITALQTIYKAQDFKGPDKEKELQALFEDNPWLIDPTYFQFMSADETQASFNDRLSKHLGVGSHAKVSNELSETEPYGTNKRPDLTFVLGNATLQKVVIVELKAPNTPLHHDHFIQLKDYMRRTKDHLKSIDGTKGKNYVVQGLLIGTRAPSQDMAREKVRRLADEEEERPQNANWEVLSIGQVLDRTKDAHKELLEAHERAKRA
jgi:hypothetical protein